MATEHKIKVQLGKTYKRESVMLDHKGRTIARGENKMELVRKIYGR